MNAQEELHEAMTAARSDGNRGAELARKFLIRHPQEKGAAGGIIAQAGIDHQNMELLNEAVLVLREATVEHPDHSNGWYNLGNALQALSEIDGTNDPEKYLQTRELRREGRGAFDRAGRIGEPHEIATQALTNLANWLSSSGRWVEAFEVYQRALGVDPTNGAAAGNLAMMLGRLARVFPRRREQLLGLASEYARIEHDHHDQSIKYLGLAGAMYFEQFPTDLPKPPTSRPADPYAQWVASKRLALAITVEGLPDGKRWDDIHVAALHQPIDASSAVPALFAMVNVLKQDYLLARKLAFRGLHESIPSDSSHYADTLDYAIYGERPATLALAQRSAVDVLDRVAVTLNEYLSTRVKPSNVYFRSYWLTGKPPDWRPGLRSELTAGSRNLLALADLAFDFDTGGYLSSYRDLRNTGTHRMVVLHDEAMGSSDPSDAVEHMPLDEFEDQLIATLRIARAALLYLVDLINEREHRNHHAPTGGFSLPLEVPGHHEIRGETG